MSTPKVLRPACRGALAFLAAAASLATFAGPARAAVVSATGPVLTFQAAAGEVNTVAITHPGGDYRFDQSGGSVTAGPGCAQMDGNSVTCPGGAITSAVVNLGDLGDSASAAGVATPAPLTLKGEAGDDQLVGGDNSDSLDGGTGNDRATGGAGGDDFVGGTGIDRVIYDDHAAGVVVDIDNAADDGNATDAGPVPGARDNVRDTVELLTGGPGADTLTGSCANNTIAPLDGTDTVNADPAVCATAGDDFMGGANGLGTANGNDTFNGGDGTDSVTYTQNTAAQGISVTLDGGANDNDGLGGTDNVEQDIETLYGGAGPDTINADFADVAGVSLFGRGLDDILTGSDSNDFVDGELGADTLDCQGGSNDLYVPDVNAGGDTSVSNCETPTNGRPLVDLNGVAADLNAVASFTQNGPAITLAPLAGVSDSDDVNLALGRIRLVNRPDGAAESLAVSTAGTAITAAAYNSATGVLTLTGTDTVADYQQVLRSATYNNTSTDPDTTSRQVEFTVSDGTVNSVTTAAIVSVARAPYEPNETMGTATGPLIAGVAYDASIERLADADNQIPEDVDWYVFYIGAAARIDVAYTLLQEGTKCFGPEARLIDSAGNTLGTAQPARNQTEHIVYDAPAAGTFFLRVRPYHVQPCEPPDEPYRFEIQSPAQLVTPPGQTPVTPLPPGGG